MDRVDYERLCEIKDEMEQLGFNFINFIRSNIKNLKSNLKR